MKYDVCLVILVCSEYINCAVNLALNIWLVPTYGYVASATGSLCLRYHTVRWQTEYAAAVFLPDPA